jgi:hypothetical protein
MTFGRLGVPTPFFRFRVQFVKELQHSFDPANRLILDEGELRDIPELEPPAEFTPNKAASP